MVAANNASWFLIHIHGAERALLFLHVMQDSGGMPQLHLTSGGHSWMGHCGRGTKRCWFGAWSQFPLKHIDAVRSEKRCRRYPGRQHSFTTDWHYHGKDWALSDLLKGIRFPGRGAEPGTQTHIFELRALSEHKMPLTPCQRWVCRATFARGWAAISEVRCWVREGLLRVLLTQQFHIISSFWVIAVLIHSSTNIPGAGNICWPGPSGNFSFNQQSFIGSNRNLIKLVWAHKKGGGLFWAQSLRSRPLFSHKWQHNFRWWHVE